MTKQNPNAIIQSILGSNTKSQTIPKSSITDSKKGSTSLEPEPRIDKKSEEPKTDKFRN